MGSVRVITTIIKFAALAFISVVGLFYIKSANFTPWNVSGARPVDPEAAVDAFAKAFEGQGVELIRSTQFRANRIVSRDNSLLPGRPAA
jgi:hypothetical protein